VFSKCLHKYQTQNEELFNSCRGENSIMFDENLVSYFPVRVYNGIDDLADTIIIPVNWYSSTVNLYTKEKFNYTQPEPVYIYTDIIKPNLFGDSYMRLLTSLLFPSNTGYNRFLFTFYKQVEQPA